MMILIIIRITMMKIIIIMTMKMMIVHSLINVHVLIHVGR
jgi:hypothetical protein